MPYTPKKKTVLEKNEVEEMIRKAYRLYEEPKDLQIASLVSFLWMSGCRISEALAVKREDIKADEDYVYVTILPLKHWIKTKDGTKKTSFPVSLPLPRKKTIFTKFIIERALALKGNSKLWDMDRTTAWRRITELNPNIYLHTFRYTRATHFANKGIKEDKMKKWFGWSKQSHMPSRYIDYSKLEMLDMSSIIEEE